MKRIEEKCNVDVKDSVRLQFVSKDLSKDNGIISIVNFIEIDDDQEDEQYKELLNRKLNDSLFVELPNNNILTKRKKKTYLLVESTNYFDYSKAVVLVQELLINVYEDYKRYCEKLKHKPICGGFIKKVESIKGDRKTVTRIINS
jgi:hypothetical protein